MRVQRAAGGTEVVVWSSRLRFPLVPPTLLRSDADEDPFSRIRILFATLDAVPRAAGGVRPPVRLEPGASGGALPPHEDVRAVLLALLVAGYDDVELDDAFPRRLHVLLEAWNASGEPR